MVVEALFWFWPPVWLIGARLIAERERACDEGVIAAGHDPEIYAGGILKVCRFCIRSPLACAAGVSGADLSLRVRQIMSGEPAAALDGGRRALLASAALLALGLPVMAGLSTTPLAVVVQHHVVAVQIRAEEAVTAVAEQIGVVPSAPVKVLKVPRLKIAVAEPAIPEPVATPDPLPPVMAQTAAADPPVPQVVPPSQTAAQTAVAPATPVKEVVRALDPARERRSRRCGDLPRPATVCQARACRDRKSVRTNRFLGRALCRGSQAWSGRAYPDRDRAFWRGRKALLRPASSGQSGPLDQRHRPGRLPVGRYSAGAMRGPLVRRGALRRCRLPLSRSR